MTYQSADKSQVYALNNLITLCIKCHNDIHEARLRIEVLDRMANDLRVRFVKLKGWKP